MRRQIELDGVVLEIVRKNIRHLHLSVHPPVGSVRISAPLRMNTDTIRLFALSKLDWIRRHQRRLRAQERHAPLVCLDGESHHVWGERCLLKVVERDAVPAVERQPGTLLLQVRPGWHAGKRQDLLTEWYRALVEAAVPPLIARWEPVLRVRVGGLAVRRMKTRWGSCSPRSGRIRLNTELATKPPECLEYVVVHEMVHLLERTHNRRFVALMDRFMPDWRSYREQLNRLPVRYEPRDC